MPLDYAGFESLVTYLESEEHEVFVLSADARLYSWVRYLTYPRKVHWLPSGARPGFLRRAIPVGVSLLVVRPSAKPGMVGRALVRGLSVADAELVLAEPSAFSLYRLQR